MSSEKVTKYRPESHLGLKFGAIWKEMALDLFGSRELMWRLFVRDFQSKYKQSLLGIAWALINPIITVSVFVFLNKSGIFNIDTKDVPYPVFALLGLTVWVVFSKGVTACTNSILSAGSLVTKISFPKASLVITAMGEAIVELMIRLSLTIIVFVIFGVVPAPTAWLFPFVILPVFFLTWGLGFFLAIMAGLFRDTTNLVALLTGYLMFLMPVAYPPPAIGFLATFNKWNPLSHIIVSAREIVLTGVISNPYAYMMSTAFCLGLFLFSWRLFHLVEARIPERI